MKNTVRAEISVVLSALLFAVTAILVKLLAGRYDGYFIALFRFLTGIALSAACIVLIKKSFRVHDKKLVIWRSFYGAIAMVTYYLAIQYSSSGRATLLNTTYPVFVLIFNALFFRIKVRWIQWASVAVCLAGVVLVFYDGSPYSILGDGLAVVSAVAAALAMHYMKMARDRNNSFVIYLSVCAAGLLGSFFSFPQFSALNWPDTLNLVLAGAIVFAAQILLTYGIKYMSAARGSILSFSKVVFTILLSLLIGEVINLRFLAGTALILAGLFLNRENQPDAVRNRVR